MLSWLRTLLLALASPVLLLLLLDSLLRAWLLLVRWLAPQAAEIPPAPASGGPIAAVIPAHDEANTIGATIARLQAHTRPKALFVIADNCTDDTALAARQAGAQVWERHRPDEPGKGVAIRWFLDAAAEELRAYYAIAIFDADSVVDGDFWPQVASALSQGAAVVQGFVQPLSGGSPAADLAAYSELLSQLIDDTARARLGWPVPLRGTGMVFRPQVLRDLLPHLQTKVEDIEMSLLLAAQGKQVVFVPGALVGDPKPPSDQGVASQRARWLQGQRQVLHYHPRLVARLLGSGRLAHISLVFANLLKPKTLVLLLKGLLLPLALLLPDRWLRGCWATLAGLALMFDWVYYIAGLRVVETPGRYARALIQAPVYMVMWLGSLIVSLVSSNPWLSARRDR
jgi:cellulose synthase/poly-beta-1,6-N-acetylglucosamine synthase-like glycosyltransferase